MLPESTELVRRCAAFFFLYRRATKNMAAPYTAAPATTPTPIPTDDGRTPEPEELFESPAAPLSALVGEAPFELDTVDPLAGSPPNKGIVGSIMDIKVLIDGFGLLYRSEFGFNRARDSVLTSEAGM